MKKTLFLTIFCTLLFLPAALAAVTYTSYYPLPQASFEFFRLVPQAEIAPLGTNCTGFEGTLYFNKDQMMVYYCSLANATAANPEWNFIPGAWRQQGSNIILRDNSNNINVGIGTYDPISKLTLGNAEGAIAADGINDGGILAIGTLGSGATYVNPGFSAANQNDTQFIWLPSRSALISGGIEPGQPARVDKTTITREDSAGHVGDYSVTLSTTTEARAAHSGILSGIYTAIDTGSPHTVVLTTRETDVINNTILNSPHSVISRTRPDSGTINTSPLSFIGMGGSILNSDSSAILGDFGSIDNSDFAFIGNSPALAADPFTGSATILNSNFAAMLSNYGSILKSSHAFIGGGENTIDENNLYATILGGKDNYIASDIAGSGTNASVILGGLKNHIGHEYDENGNIHYEPAKYGFIGGGENNTVRSDYSIVLGGKDNDAGKYIETVTDIPASHAIVSGGLNNKAYAPFSFIGGGENNRIGMPPAIVDPVNGDDSTDGKYSVIGGGRNNTILGDYAFIGTGDNITIDHDGDYSVVETGRNIYITGHHSYAFGQNISVEADNAFVFGYKSDEDAHTNDADPSNDEPLRIQSTGGFIIYNVPNVGSGIEAMRVGIQTLDPQFTLDVNGTIQATSLVISALPPQQTFSEIYWSPSTNAIGKRDLAELFLTSEDVEPGDVLVISESNGSDIRLKKSRQPYDRTVVGVVSTSPALVFEGDRIVSFSSVAEKGTHPPVALTGQVPCKVSLENGPIEPGDLLTTSSTPGYAMKATADIDHIGTIIGKALMPFNKTISENSDMGIINVFLSLQ